MVKASNLTKRNEIFFFLRNDVYFISIKTMHRYKIIFWC